MTFIQLAIQLSYIQGPKEKYWIVTSYLSSDQTYVYALMF